MFLTLKSSLSRPGIKSSFWASDNTNTLTETSETRPRDAVTTPQQSTPALRSVTAPSSGASARLTAFCHSGPQTTCRKWAALLGTSGTWRGSWGRFTRAASSLTVLLPADPPRSSAPSCPLSAPPRSLSDVLTASCIFLNFYIDIFPKIKKIKKNVEWCESGPQLSCLHLWPVRHSLRLGLPGLWLGCLLYRPWGLSGAVAWCRRGSGRGHCPQLDHWKLREDRRVRAAYRCDVIKTTLLSIFDANILFIFRPSWMCRHLLQHSLLIITRHENRHNPSTSFPYQSLDPSLVSLPASPTSPCLSPLTSPYPAECSVEVSVSVHTFLWTDPPSGLLNILHCNLVWSLTPVLFQKNSKILKIKLKKRKNREIDNNKW